MSSFKGIAIIDGKERTLLRAEYTLYKLKDITGNPTTTTRKSPFHLMFESTGFDSDLYHYMFSPNASFSGELIFYDRDEFKTLYKVEFHKAYIVGLTEEFDNQDNLPLHINLEITCGAVKIKDVKKIENWVFEDPFIEVEPTVIEQQEEPEIIEMYYTDLEGNKMPKNNLKRGKEVFFVLKTLNAAGKELAIDLDNNKLDFEYNNEVLTDDILHVNITADTMKLKLKTITEQN